MKFTRKHLTIAATGLGLGGLALAGLAIADPGSGGDGFGMGMRMMGHGRHHNPMQMMQRAEDFADRYDANKDGKISQQEIDQNRQQWLTDADTNKDGKLDLQEFQSLWVRAHHERMVREFQKFDRNGDGAVALDEYTAPLKDVVSLLDTNKDSVLSRDDMQNSMNMMHQAGRGGGHMRGYMMNDEEGEAGPSQQGGTDAQ